MDLFRFIPGYESAIYETGREPAFIMLLAFVVTFILARGYTRLARKYGWGSASFGGVHTHHLVFGIVMAFIAGALVFGFNPTPGPFLLLLAALFGSGVALVLDEFALVFHLQDVYWENEGRKSVDAIILALIFGVIFLLQVTPFGTRTQESGGLIATAIAINLPIVMIAALKGKIFTAILGVFVPGVALIGAIRLAEPGSIWSKKIYGANSKKLKRSIKRYKQYEKEWKPRKEWLRDFIGGKPGRPLN